MSRLSSFDLVQEEHTKVFPEVTQTLKDGFSQITTNIVPNLVGVGIFVIAMSISDICHGAVWFSQGMVNLIRS